jgi:hypothetical protein
VRADICEPDDDYAVERFRQALRRMGADLSEKGWGLGVHVYRVTIRGEQLTIFSDDWSIDVEGPDELVRAVLQELKA